MTNKTLLNYIGNYDYYLEKKPDVEAAYLSKIVDTGNVGSTLRPGKLPFSSEASNSSSTVISENKLSWQQQKEEQARQRKRQNDLKKTEEEISTLEARNNEIDDLLTKEEVYTDVPKLMKLNKERKEIETRLEELLLLWEDLAEDD